MELRIPQCWESEPKPCSSNTSDSGVCQCVGEGENGTSDASSCYDDKEEEKEQKRKKAQGRRHGEGRILEKNDSTLSDFISITRVKVE